MNNHSKFLRLLAMACLPACALAACASVGAATRVAKLVPKIARSIVVVQYTAENEFHKTNKLSGQGIVLNKKGVVLVSSDLIPQDVPLDYIHHLKIRIARGDMPKIPAEYLGRTVDGLFCYVKALKPLDAVPINVGAVEKPYLAESVFSVGRLGKDQAYGAFVGVNRIKAMIPLVHTLIATDSFGLTDANSPVFDYRTGKFVGITVPNPGDGMILTLLNRSVPVTLRDNQQVGMFIAYDSFQQDLTDIPNKRFVAKIPWLGTLDSTGLRSAVRKLYNIKQRSGLMIGQVIPGMPAAKGGLKSRDIILTVDGQPFAHTPVAALMVARFEHRMQQLKPGQVVKLGILRNGKPKNIAITVGLAPTPPSRLPRYYDRKIGLVVHNLAFIDTYSRKLPPTQNGVYVVLVHNGKPASLGTTPVQPGYIITRVDDHRIDNITTFKKLVTKAENTPGKPEIIFEVIKGNGRTAACHVSLN
jgi:S1-C subfamily serine protease